MNSREGWACSIADFFSQEGRIWWNEQVIDSYTGKSGDATQIYMCVWDVMDVSQ